jgi:hypothetical protein
MGAAIIGLVLLIVLILVAIKMISDKNSPDEAGQMTGIKGPLIHTSGMYSIIRKSPREDLLRIRPPAGEIRKYLSSLNEDINRLPLSEAEKQRLGEKWRQSMEDNIRVVEQGDADEVEFYYYDFPGDTPCPGCASYLHQGQFVSRQEIFKYPSIIPPFHLGCTTRVVAYRGKENLRETTIRGMAPFFGTSDLPQLPEWKKTFVDHS